MVELEGASRASREEREQARKEVRDCGRYSYSLVPEDTTIYQLFMRPKRLCILVSKGSMRILFMHFAILCSYMYVHIMRMRYWFTHINKITT